MKTKYSAFCHENLIILVYSLFLLAVVFGTVVAFSAEPTDIRPDFSIHDTDIKIAEGIWQGLHAIDVATTFKGPGMDTCYGEGDPITSRIIGTYPTKASIVGWGIGYAALHYVVTAELSEHNAPRWVQWTWQALQIADTGRDVAHNFSIGIRFGGANVHPGCVSKDRHETPVLR